MNSQVNPAPEAWYSWVAAASVASLVTFGLVSCFVDPTTPSTASGSLAIDPAGAVLRPGYTTEFHLTLTGEGIEGAELEWNFSQLVSTFDIVEGLPDDPSGLRITGVTSVAADYDLSARIAGMPETEVSVPVRVVPFNFGNPAPAYRRGGVDAHDAKGWVAAGGGKDLTAYANYGSALTGAPTSGLDTSVIERFDSATNAQDDTSVLSNLYFLNTPPNIAADCQGNAYWFDFIAFPGDFGFGGEFVFYKLRFDSGDMEFPEEYSLRPGFGFDFFSVDLMAVGSGDACDSEVFFVAQERSSGRRLWRLPMFDPNVAPVVLDINGDPNLTGLITSMAVDHSGRLLVFLTDFEVTTELIRILPDVDPTQNKDLEFDPDPMIYDGFLRVLATDAEGLIYVATSTLSGDQALNLSTIYVLNPFGDLVGEITSYVWCCPDCPGDPPTCEPTDACARLDVPFQNIQSLAATADGQIRVVDNVFEATLPEGQECDTASDAVRVVYVVLGEAE